VIPSRAIAQAAATATGPGSSVTVGGGLSLANSAYGQRDLEGGWLFSDFYPQWRFGFEVEARYLRLHQSEDVKEANYLIGPRLFLHSGREQIYAKFLVGDGHIDLPFRYGSGDFLALAPGGGIDLALNDYVSVRAFDFEYQLWRDFPFGPMRPYSVSAGLSVRVTRIVRLPKSSRVRGLGRLFIHRKCSSIVREDCRS
jgi:hypothetical protein